MISLPTYESLTFPSPAPHGWMEKLAANFALKFRCEGIRFA